MATGASNAELAILPVDVRKGLVEQTRRHAAVVVAIPLSKRLGDNVAVRSARTPWYTGPALLGHLVAAILRAGAGRARPGVAHSRTHGRAGGRSRRRADHASRKLRNVTE